MKEILGTALAPDGAALWFLGQAGYIVRSGNVVLAIDPYLTDSSARHDPALSRLLPVPIDPSELKADLFLVTHDHSDHLDPETVAAYRHKEETVFVAPRLACRKLIALGVPEQNVTRIDSGETATVAGLSVTGVYAVPTEPGAIDTAGYLVRFSNGRSFYHTGDTGFSDLLLAAAPAAEVLLVCINGKWGNLDAEQAARLAAAVRPRFAVPNHYDMMAINSENPKAFEFFLEREAPQVQARVLGIMEPFVWRASGEEVSGA